MDRVRGALMLIAAVLAFWQGWRIHPRHTAMLAFALGAAALALAAWHFTRKPPRPKV
jgi:hypothetical protein